MDYLITDNQVSRALDTANEQKGLSRVDKLYYMIGCLEGMTGIDLRSRDLKEREA
jgi:hypothetical protein